MKKIVNIISIIMIALLSLSILKTNNKELKQHINKEEKIELNETINIKLPIIKDKCNQDFCITNNFYQEILNHFNINNYEQIKVTPYIYFKNASNLIKITFNEENIEKNTNNENKEVLTYNFNRYTTIDDLIKILNHQNINTYTGEPATEIPVLNYHFFYDKKTEKCNESICIDIENFEEQIKYLKNNNYKTLTISEYKNWIYQEIDLPKKSILITIDDGAMGTSKINGNKLIPILEKYEINATLFLITGWWDSTNYQSNFLDIQSHTHLMHDENICSNQKRGAELLCSSKEKIISDLNKSLEEVDNNISFCFPFYLYDSKSIEVLKELDFKIAFIGGNKKTNQNMNKYNLTRFIIYKNTTLERFKEIIN